MQDKSVLDCGAIQKNPKRCKNLTERRRQRARITPWQTSSTDGVAEKYSSCVRAPFSEVLILAPSSFLLWRRVKAHRRAPRSTAERRAPADARALPPPGHAGVRVQPRSSCRACQNGRRGPRIIRRNARDARARSHAAAATVCCRFPRSVRSLALQSRLPVYKPLPINSAGDRVADCLTRFRSMPVGETSATSTCAPA